MTYTSFLLSQLATTDRRPNERWKVSIALDAVLKFAAQCPFQDLFHNYPRRKLLFLK